MGYGQTLHHQDTHHRRRLAQRSCLAVLRFTGNGHHPYSDGQRYGVLRKLETHDYELYLGINGIEHTKTKVRHLQTNGICERFHKTIEPSCMNFTRLPSGVNCTILWKICRPTWTLGWSITTTSGRIKGKSAAAEHHYKHSLMENKSVRKRSDNSINRTSGDIKTELIVRSSLNYYILSTFRENLTGILPQTARSPR